MSAVGVARSCPLCAGVEVEPFHVEKDRSFLRCAACALVFLDPGRRLPYDAEVARYELHDNRADDPDYRAFLSRLAEPVIARTPPGARGLDFGCGQVPVLGDILSDSGRPTRSYDPHFHPDDSLLSASYDFLTCSEVIEHVFDPLPLLERFGSLVRPGGVIGIMTRFYDHATEFGDWWYRRDPTHVCFYSRQTMEWIGRRLSWEGSFPVPNVVLFLVS